VSGEIRVAHVGSKQANPASGLVGQHFALLTGYFGPAPNQLLMVKAHTAEGIAAITECCVRAQSGISFVFVLDEGGQAHLSPLVKALSQGKAKGVAHK